MNLITYGSSAAYLGTLSFSKKKCLKHMPGDYVTHLLWTSAFGMVIAQTLDQVIVHRTISLGTKRILDDESIDE